MAGCGGCWDDGTGGGGLPAGLGTGPGGGSRADLRLSAPSAPEAYPAGGWPVSSGGAPELAGAELRRFPGGYPAGGDAGNGGGSPGLGGGAGTAFPAGIPALLALGGPGRGGCWDARKKIFEN